MDEKTAKKLIEKINVLIRLTASGILGGKKPQDKIEILSGMGLKPSEISEILGLKRNYVTAALSNIKKRTSKGRLRRTQKSG